MNKASFSLLCSVALLVLAACGGGGGGGSDPIGSGGGGVAGIDRLGVSTGTVTGFGSILLNGGEIGTTGAQFLVDDNPGGQDDLSVGDVVTVTFDPDVVPPSAQTVFSDEAVEGPIDSLDAATGILVVAGQTVRVDAETSFDDSLSPPSLAALTAGDFIEVQGLFDSNGDIRATRIEPKPAGTVEVHGPVSGLNAAALTFSVNALTVDYSAAVIDDRFPGGSFANGDRVEVKGTLNAGGVLRATKVEPDGLGVAADDRINLDDFDEVEVEVEGFITRFASASDFDVAGFPVTTNDQTVFEFEDGSLASGADLGLNVKVEVEGQVGSAGTLVAEKVDVRRARAVRIAAQVDSVSGNTLTLLGVTVRVDELTRVEDKRDDVEPFGLADISAGDFVEVRGSDDASGAADVVAALLERDDLPNPGNPGADTELQGFVDSVAQPSLTILGVTVETGGGAVFRDVNDQPIGAAAFFAAVGNGSLVKAKGFESSATGIVAEEVELEN